MIPELQEFRIIRDQIAGEAADQYLIVQPADWPQPENTAAFASIGRNLMLRDHLEAIGEWNEWHSGIVIVPPVPTDWTEFLGLLLHEQAHCLPAICLPDVKATDVDRQKQQAMVLAWAATDPSPLLQSTPWLAHGCDFIRRLLHLAHRASLLGHELPLPTLMHCDQYQLSGLWRYKRALADEPEQMVDYSFAEIENSDMPHTFRELFEADVEAWRVSLTRKGITDEN